MAATYPHADQIKCIERELAMRRSVYANRVRDRKMTQATADTEIGRMEAVLATLQGGNFRVTLSIDRTDFDAVLDALRAHGEACGVLFSLVEETEGRATYTDALRAARETVEKLADALIARIRTEGA